MTRNRYPARCVRCGKLVQPNDGFMLGRDVTHETCVPVVDVDALLAGRRV